MSGNRTNYLRNFSLVLVVTLVLTIPTTELQAQSSGNPGIIPPNARPYGLSYGRLSALWWKWAFSIPLDKNPLLDDTGANCAEGQNGPVWFLSGTGGGSATRRCTIPLGKSIFLPVVTVVAGSGVFDCDPTVSGVPCDVPALRTLLASLLDNPTLLEADVDGLPLQNLNAYRAISPEFSITYPANSYTGVAEGTYTPQVCDGYWIMLAPLSAGNHTIRVRGIIDFFGSPFESEATYNLTVGN